jgi:molybdate transport system regulatory protein
MKVSARNTLKGKVTGLINGAVNAEIELTTSGGDKLIAVVTETSVKTSGLSIGKEAVAYIKAPWVMLVTGKADVIFSARNQLTGKVKNVVKGAINTEVEIELPGGANIYSVITNDASEELELKVGVDVTAIIKASHIILGVPLS